MIVCFSGTGNTRAVAQEMARITGDRVYELDNKSFAHLEEVELPDVQGNDKVIWAFPIYSWGLPPVVAGFIRNFRISPAISAAKHYMLATCGDDLGYADRLWRKCLAKRGLKAEGAFSVIMPNTYVCMKGFDVDAPAVVKSKIQAMPERVRFIGQAISAGGKDSLCRGAFPWLKTYVVYPWFVKYKITAKPFWTTDACTGCGKCASECPLGNIAMKKAGDGVSRPTWGNDCTLCLRCYHGCPQRAIRWGKVTDGKGQQMLRSQAGFSGSSSESNR